MTDLPTLIESARRAALEPEQPLIRMMFAKRTSVRALTLARDCYLRAAESMQQALDIVNASRGPST